VGQFFRVQIFYIGVRGNRLNRCTRYIKEKERKGKELIMSLTSKLLSTLTTAAGTRVTKYFGVGNKVVKEIKYAPNSRMAKLGVDKVTIKKAGKEGKRILVFNNKGTCIMKGNTKPSWEPEQSILDQMREYVNAAKTMLEKGVKLG